MKINEEGLNIIKTFEGCRLKAYHDAGGILTIGYGHTGDDVYLGQIITQERANNLLYTDILSTESGVDKILTVPVTSNQFSALVSFAYNVGVGNLKHSKLLAAVNLKDFPKAADNFPKWIHDGDKVLPGLVKRREAERALFLKGDSNEKV